MIAASALFWACALWELLIIWSYTIFVTRPQPWWDDSTQQQLVNILFSFQIVYRYQFSKYSDTAFDDTSSRAPPNKLLVFCYKREH